MIPDLRNTKESPGHFPVICRKMAGIFCFLLKIHPRRQRIRCLPLLFLGRDGGCAIALLRTVAVLAALAALDAAVPWIPDVVQEAHLLSVPIIIIAARTGNKSTPCTAPPDVIRLNKI